MPTPWDHFGGEKPTSGGTKPWEVYGGTEKFASNAGNVSAPQEKRGVVDRLLGLGGERYQLWPEKAVRGVYQDIKGAVESAKNVEQGKGTIEQMAAPVFRAAVDVVPTARVPRLVESKLAAPATEDLLGGFKSGLEQVKDVPISPERIAELKKKVLEDLEKSPSRDFIAPAVYKAVNEIEAHVGRPNPAEALQKYIKPKNIAEAEKARELRGAVALGDKGSAGRPSTVADVEMVRRLLGNVPFEQRAPANIARDRINEFLSTLAPRDVGGGVNVGEHLTRLRGNYAAGKRAERLEESIDKAERRTEKTGSGANFVNVAKQEIDRLLNDKKFMRGVSAQEEQAMRDFVKTGSLDQVLRVAKNLGPKHPVSGWLPALLATVSHGDLAGLAMLGVGHGAQKLGEARGREKLMALQELMRRRSPLYQEMGGASHEVVTPSAYRQAILPLLQQLGLGGGAPQIPRIDVYRRPETAQ